MSLGRKEHGRKFLELLFEVLLISVGVFLGLWANNWHEEHEHRDKARAALGNFLEEMQVNEQAIEQHRQYHEKLVRDLGAFLDSGEPATSERFQKEVDFRGVQPVIFEHTAWDLAIATQALSYLPPELAFDISKVYTGQEAFQSLENSFLASAFAPTTISAEDKRGFALAMKIYLIDVNIMEPKILERYRQVIPEIKRAIGPASGP
jgi:hypothetical protein